MAQGISLGLGSASAAPGRSVNLDILLNSTGTRPAALQWTIGYSTADISSINVTAGSGAINAGKIIACNPTPGSVICIVYGLNDTTIPNGVVATVQLTVSASTINTSTATSLSGGVAADPNGDSITPVATTGATISITPAVPGVVVTSVTNAASGAGGAIAPGEVVAIKGTGLGPDAAISFSVNPGTGMVDSTLGGVRVLFGTFAAPIMYASATQVNAIVPYEIAGQSRVACQVQFGGRTSDATILAAASAAPGVFTVNATGAGQAVAVNQDGSSNSPLSPAVKGSYVTIYFTGGGPTSPAGVTGSVNGLVPKWLTQSISVSVGGAQAAITFDGAAPTLVDGVNQLNIKLADDTPSGPAQPLVINVGGIASPSIATLAIR